MATATESMHVKAQPREARGKNASRRLRAQSSIPAVLYGANQPVRSLAVDPKQIGRILHSDTGHNTIFDLELDGEKTKAMIVDWQYEPIKGSLLHIDLKRIAMDRVLRVSVPIVLKGEAAGVKQQGGILEQVLREVEVECLPADIPSHLDVDVSELVFGQVLRVADLPRGEGKLKFVTEEGLTVAHIVSVKEIVEPTPEAAAAEAAAAPAEPEVIKKGKQETAEEGAAPAEGKEAKAEKPEKAEKKERK
ncbi:MAG TPA: 50S ribosomal protein L25 [Terriglobales bacterium]|nr:50S ribosomal protein L25 [Terriglobales bacterium]